MPILLRLATTAIIATLMAMLGMAFVEGRVDGAWSSLTFTEVVPRSVVFWLLAAIPLAGLPAIVGMYAGLLSPLIGGLSFGPMGILIVLFHAPHCFCIGIATGLLVSLVWRIDFEALRAANW
jgi:hypothetical protein